MITLIIVILIIFLPGEGYSHNFNAGSRAGAAGSAYTALADDALSVFYNPAGLTSLRSISSDLTYGWSGFLQLENWSVLYAKPSYEDSYLALGMLKRKFVIDGMPYRSFHLIMPTTFRISKFSSAGLNLKYLNQKTGTGEYKSKFGMDFGFRLEHGIFRYGFTARNLPNPGMESFLPEFANGVAIKTKSMRFETDIFASDYDELKSANRGIRMGGEINIGDNYAVRAGYKKYQGKEFVSIGIGVYSLFRINGFDYCYITEKKKITKGEHWISYTFLAP